jgi:hypothetical protein
MEDPWLRLLDGRLDVGLRTRSDTSESTHDGTMILPKTTVKDPVSDMRRGSQPFDGVSRENLTKDRKTLSISRAANVEEIWKDAERTIRAPGVASHVFPQDQDISHRRAPFRNLNSDSITDSAEGDEGNQRSLARTLPSFNIG